MTRIQTSSTAHSRIFSLFFQNKSSSLLMDIIKGQVSVERAGSGSTAVMLSVRTPQTCEQQHFNKVYTHMLIVQSYVSRHQSFLASPSAGDQKNKERSFISSAITFVRKQASFSRVNGNLTGWEITELLTVLTQGPSLVQAGLNTV